MSRLGRFSGPGASSWWALVALYLFTLAAATGYGVFGLHPELLPATGTATLVYRWSFRLFAQAQILLAAVVLAVALARAGGMAWLPAAAAVCTVSFLSEHLGTGYGVPFGEYAYTGLLGPRLGGRVPMLIPLSWFLMALPSYALARHAFPRKRRRAARLITATGLLVTWDLALDPAMSHLTAYWVWEASGAYYGMPAVNLLGWTATGLILMALLEVLGARERTARVSASWWAGYWLAVLLMPLGMLVVAGAWGAVTTTGAAALLLASPSLRRTLSRRGTGRRPARPRSEQGLHGPASAATPGSAGGPS